MSKSSMDQHLWQRVKTVTADAWERPAATRAAFITEACAGNAALYREVVSLLSAMDEAGDRFDAPPTLTIPETLLPDDGVVVETVSVGQRLGPWTLVRELGHGGMGTVYLADRADAEFAQRAAIKIVRGGASDERLVARFREERRILAALDHPHIARLIDGGATPLGLPYVVMEYVDGERIDVFCDRRQLGRRERITLFRRVCEAAYYAHQRLIVHRDIKATNILVTADGVPKLLDFGIAKILESGRAADATAFRMITPESASPEQIRGEPITTAADVYALGVLLYRLLAGRSPYRLTETTETELMRAVCEQTPDAPSVVVPSIETDLDRIVLKALRKEPERRYGSADQLSDDLQRYLDGRPVLAAPDSNLYRARKFVARHRLGVAVSAALVVAVAAGTAATAWQARVARRERARAERQFNSVRTLASSVLGELHDAVSTLNGSTAARELLLRRATEYLDGLAQEAGGDVALRRELAAGYRRLGEVQGDSGKANVGDADATLASYRKALALLEPIAGSAGEPSDRLLLVSALVTVAGVEKNADTRHTYHQRALALVDGLPAELRASAEGHRTAASVWYALGRERLGAKDYAGAKAAFLNDVREATAALAIRHDDAQLHRTLSIAFKQVGTAAHMQERLDEAIDYYRQSLALDRTRVEMTKGAAEARLDLSYSYGAVGSALMDKSDTDGAREQYRQAIALRRALAAEDPENDRALDSVAFGYLQLARVESRAGNVSGAFAAQETGLALFRDRAAAHAERSAPWIDYADALFIAADEGAAWLESRPMAPAERARFGARVRTMIADLAALRTRWATEHREEPLPPSDAEFQRVRDRAHRLPPTAPAAR